jgi:6,7-dimethyl-8-ribityllumazine synthase
MTGSGAPQLPAPDGAGLRVAIAVARWHATLTEALLAGARRALAQAGVAAAMIVEVPGAFELPVTARALARSHDAVIALGVVIRGGTPHFDYVCQAAALGLTQVAADTGTPVGFGVLTCDDEQQAYDRAGLPGSSEDKGYQAAAAALATALRLRELDGAHLRTLLSATKAGDDAWSRPLSGVVVRGDGRGRELGVPTANLYLPAGTVLPQDGVYAGWLLTGAEKLPAAISVGVNVTFDATERRVEAHVIDHPGLDLYGHLVQLDLVRRLRPMRRFARIEDLQASMATDLGQARAALCVPTPP